MTKVSSKFCFTIREGTDPFVAYSLGFLLCPLMKNLFSMENGLEMIRIVAERFPEIEILQE